MMWGELSSEDGVSCLLYMGRVVLRESCLGASCPAPNWTKAFVYLFRLIIFTGKICENKTQYHC